MRIPQIYCMMNSGKPLTDEVRQVLLINACDMAEAGNEFQKVKGRRYEGVIKSDLESLSYAGLSIILFEAEITCPEIGFTKVRYGVRTQDLDEGLLALGKWSSLSEIMAEAGYEPRQFNPEWN